MPAPDATGKVESMSQRAKDAAEFGAWLTERMAENSIGARDLAASCDVATITAANWASGRSLPDATHVVVIAGLLGVSVDEALWLAGYAKIAKAVDGPEESGEALEP